jgi:hypothetical protein
MLRRSSKKLSKFLTRIKMVIFQPMRWGHLIIFTFHEFFFIKKTTLQVLHVNIYDPNVFGHWFLQIKQSQPCR